MKIYLYKMTVDNGGAPCVRDGLLSLAICKPVIRRVAPEGSLLFGFAGNGMESRGYADNCLIYVASVTERRDGRTYYMHSSKDESRPDQIYQYRDGIFSRRTGARYHTEADLEHDLGQAGHYPNSSVLLSTDFRYFGQDGPVPKAKSIRSLLDALTQGARCNFTQELESDLHALRHKAFSTLFADRHKTATPVQAMPQGKSCSSEGATASNDPHFRPEDDCSC